MSGPHGPSDRLADKMLGQAPVGGQDRLDEIAARRASLAGHTCLDLDWLPSIDWLVGEVSDRRTDLAMALTHLRDAMGEIARLRGELEAAQEELARLRSR